MIYTIAFISIAIPVWILLGLVRNLDKRVRNEARLKGRLAEEVENAATYKQERDEIVANYETVAAQLTEARRQNADLMAIIDKRDEALGFIPLDKGMDMQDELREVNARLAEAVTLLEAIDNADAITIDRDFPAVDVAIAEALWESIHRITTEYAERPADSASDVLP